MDKKIMVKLHPTVVVKLINILGVTHNGLQGLLTTENNEEDKKKVHNLLDAIDDVMLSITLAAEELERSMVEDGSLPLEKAKLINDVNPQDLWVVYPSVPIEA